MQQNVTSSSLGVELFHSRKIDIDLWISGTPRMTTKTLRMDELESLDPLNWGASITEPGDGHFDSSQFQLGGLETFSEDYYEDNENRNAPPNIANTEDKTLIDEVLIYLEEEYPRLNNMLPPNAGTRYYTFSNPHKPMNRILWPRRCQFGDFEPPDGTPDIDENESTTQTEEGSLRNCSDLECEECEENLLMVRYEHHHFPRDSCEQLFDVQDVRKEAKSGVVEFICQFCQNQRWMPLAEQNTHLELAHGIVVDGLGDVTLLLHPKLLFEQLTYKGYFTTCLCGGCRKWVNLVSDNRTSKLGGLFEPFFSHLKTCPMIPKPQRH